MNTRGSTLGAFLRARREDCRPEDVGIACASGRRVAGLRRDEVAQRAGMSVDYYMRLEQGRAGTPSPQIIDALGRALRLTGVGIDYMYRLTGVGTRSVPTDVDRGRLDGVLGHWGSTPAYVADSNLDIVAANRSMAAVSNGAIDVGANAALLAFTPETRAQLDDWEYMARETAGALRYLGDDRSPRYQEVVRQLSADPDFVRIWARHEVRVLMDRAVTAEAPGIGTLTLRIQNFFLPDLSGYTVTIYGAEPGSRTAHVLDALAASAGVTST